MIPGYQRGFDDHLAESGGSVETDLKHSLARIIYLFCS